MATISISREELMEKLLEAKRKADKEDAKFAAVHHKQEQAALRAFREVLKSASKWDYKTLKKNGMEVRVPYSRRPSCPRRNAVPIELSIRQLNMDSRKGRFRLSDGSDWYKAATWLPESKRPKASVCD